MQIVLKIVQQLSISSPSIWRPQPQIRVNFVDNLVKYTRLMLRLIVPAASTHKACFNKYIR